MTICDLYIARDIQEFGYNGEFSKMYVHVINAEYHLIEAKSFKNDSVDEIIPAPRLDDVQYFLRDNYGINIIIDFRHEYSYNFWIKSERLNICKFYDVDYETYEEALEAAIKKSIKIIQTI